MEKPKKERKFLKAIGRLAKTLGEELVLGIGRKYIGKVVDKIRIGKRQQMTILFALSTTLTFASVDSIPYPITGNKQRLGYNTTGNGLVWRGLASDTVTKPTNYADKNVKAYLVLDSVTGSLYIWKQGLWAEFTSSFTQPVDSLFFDTSVSPNNVDTAKMRWDYDLATVVLGMYDQVPNELGFKNFWLVKNQTGSTIAKGNVVYASGTVGSSGRIAVSKFIANGTIEAKLVLGVTAHDLSNGEDGYVIDFGKIRQVNTDTFAAGAILYPSPTTAGAFTDVEPQAPNITMPIAFCINSSSNNGTIAVRVASGYKMHEIQDVDTTGIDVNGGLVYNGSYFVASNGALITASDTASMLSNYATKAYADTTGRFYARQDFTNVSSSTLTWTQSDTLITGGVNVVQVYRNGQILLPTQYTIPTNASVVIGATAYKAGENYTVIFPRGGGAGSGGGSGSLTSISAGTGITVSPDPITTSGTVSADLSVLMELTDTSLLNLSSRFAAKQNTITLTTTGTSGASTLVGSTLNIPQYASGSGTVTSVATGYGLSGGTITTSGTLLLDSATVFNRIRDSIVDVAIGTDTIKILKQEYPAQTSAILNWTVTSKFPIQLKAYILVFRNGQLLNNNQYDITDTAQITLVSSSFKSGANYTVATVSGIGSIGSAQGNPIYPEAGIAVSTGTTWTTSITNNSTNWNTAYTDRLKWDGGSTGLTASTGRTSLGGTTIGQNMFTLTNPSAIRFPRFNSDNTISALSDADFRTAIGTGRVTSVTAASTAGNPISITDIYTTPTIELLSATSGRNGYLTSTDWTTFNNKQNALSNASSSVSGILTSTDWTTFNNKQNALTLTTTGSSGAATLVGSTLNIPQYSGGGGTVTNVTGVAPISVINNTTTPEISVASATGSVSGVVTTSAQTFAGTKTFTGNAIVNGSLTVNEDGSSVGVFRVEGDNNTSLIQTAPATDYVGIGRVPDNSFDVQGAVRFRTLTSNGTPTRIIGADATGDINQITLGTGLSLSSGTLSATATGTVTSVGLTTGTSGSDVNVSGSPVTSSGSITLNIPSASTSNRGLVTIGTQTFGGFKFFPDGIDANTIGADYISRSYVTITSVTYTVPSDLTWLTINRSTTCTLTLPSASTYAGRELHIKTINTGTVVSGSSNVVPLAGGSAGVDILAGTAGKWATLVSDGSNWIIMQAN